MPTWVKCTTLQDEPILVNLDNVSTLHWNAKATPNYTMVAFSGGMTASVKVKETPDQIVSVKQPATPRNGTPTAQSRRAT